MMIENHAQACDDGNNNTGEKKMNMLNATLAFFFLWTNDDEITENHQYH